MLRIANPGMSIEKQITGPRLTRQLITRAIGRVYDMLGKRGKTGTDRSKRADRTDEQYGGNPRGRLEGGRKQWQRHRA
jgi:hypothetical protein